MLFDRHIFKNNQTTLDIHFLPSQRFPDVGFKNK